MQIILVQYAYNMYQIIEEQKKQLYMKTEKAYHSKEEQRQSRQPIRAYVKLFPSAGLDSVQENEYEIIDGNTFLHRKDGKNFSMDSFSFIYNHQFDHSKIIEHMNLIDDAFESKSQTLIFDLHKDILKRFVVGTIEETGFIIELFKKLYDQVYSQMERIDKSEDLYRDQNISVAIFASELNSNKYIDLISGQNFTFYSKRDMDRYKDFYDRIIIQMKQFLIVFKIALIHYTQCCKQGSPIIFRIIVNKFDPISQSFIRSTLHVLICDSQTRTGQCMTDKLDILMNKNHSRMQDNGSLFNYFERFILSTKISYLFGIPFRKSLLQESKKKFFILATLKNLSTSIKLSTQKRVDEGITDINRREINKYKSGGLKSFNHKEVSLLIKLLKKFTNFLDDSLIKYQSYWDIMENIVEQVNEFYNRERFPISTEIKEYSIKRFMISKIYKLSQTFRLQDLCPKMQKLRRLKNQIALSLKSLKQSKQLQQLQNLRVKPLCQYLLKNLSEISLVFKLIFQLDYRSVCALNCVHELETMNCNKFIKKGFRDRIKIGRVLDSTSIKQLMRILQQQTKSLPYNEKEIMIRQIMAEGQQPVKVYQSGLKSISANNNEEYKSSLLGYRKSCEILEQYQMQKRSDNIEQGRKWMKIDLQRAVLKNRDHGKKQLMTDSGNILQRRGKQHSVIITNLSQRYQGFEKFDKYSLLLPKIAILTKRKQLR